MPLTQEQVRVFLSTGFPADIKGDEAREKAFLREVGLLLSLSVFEAEDFYFFFLDHLKNPTAIGAHRVWCAPVFGFDAVFFSVWCGQNGKAWEIWRGHFPGLPPVQHPITTRRVPERDLVAFVQQNSDVLLLPYPIFKGAGTWLTLIVWQGSSHALRILQLLQAHCPAVFEALKDRAGEGLTPVEWVFFRIRENEERLRKQARGECAKPILDSRVLESVATLLLSARATFDLSKGPLAYVLSSPGVLQLLQYALRNEHPDARSYWESHYDKIEFWQSIKAAGSLADFVNIPVMGDRKPIEMALACNARMLVEFFLAHFPTYFLRLSRLCRQGILHLEQPWVAALVHRVVDCSQETVWNTCSGYIDEMKAFFVMCWDTLSVDFQHQVLQEYARHRKFVMLQYLFEQDKFPTTLTAYHALHTMLSEKHELTLLEMLRTPSVNNPMCEIFLREVRAFVANPRGEIPVGFKDYWNTGISIDDRETLWSICAADSSRHNVLLALFTQNLFPGNLENYEGVFLALKESTEEVSCQAFALLTTPSAYNPMCHGFLEYQAAKTEQEREEDAGKIDFAALRKRGLLASPSDRGRREGASVSSSLNGGGGEGRAPASVVKPKQ